MLQGTRAKRPRATYTGTPFSSGGPDRGSLTGGVAARLTGCFLPYVAQFVGGFLTGVLRVLGRGGDRFLSGVLHRFDSFGDRLLHLLTDLLGSVDGGLLDRFQQLIGVLTQLLTRALLDLGGGVGPIGVYTALTEGRVRM